ncbi:uncharacterized protein LOC132905129 isoform X2 [Bombus pascuorum]|uniref:uncharacterized protein LOC132905129 isoform X2 n=1 Tax=Bombus pascuorum TaxID=65598 RepID=UPI00298D8048|nr:uncharacterized protein LOC132905129 isoform X2 [Bombus pascuorum]
MVDPDIRARIEEETRRRWRSQLQEEAETQSHRAVNAVLPNWDKWRKVRGVPLTYRMTLTGHIVFGEFLQKIQREVTNICHHCGEAEDRAQHTLEHCPAWEIPRHILRLRIGENLTPEEVVEALLRCRPGYDAVCEFCEQVMLAKEQAERIRIRTGHLARVQRSRKPERNGGGRPPSPLRVGEEQRPRGMAAPGAILKESLRDRRGDWREGFSQVVIRSEYPGTPSLSVRRPRGILVASIESNKKWPTGNLQCSCNMTTIMNCVLRLKIITVSFRLPKRVDVCLMPGEVHNT